jgi:glycosyltransferase involved in cell wall biosynthesis
MKVWHLISNRWNSAISEYAISTARALDDLGAQQLVTPLRGSPVELRFDALKFSLESVDHFGPSAYVRLISLSSKFAPDVVFTYGGPETTAAFFFKTEQKIIRFYGQRVEDQGIPRGIISRLAHRHVRKVVAPSKLVADPLQKLLGCDVNVITLGCDQKTYYFNDTNRSARPEILVFGRLDPVKGHREFLATFRKILEMAKSKGDPCPRLRIVGLPANLSETHIRTAADGLGLSSDDVVIQCERVQDVAALMSGTSLGLVSSIGSEIICRVAQEFLMCGTPVVTTSVGSLPEIFTNEQFGTTYDHHRPDDSLDAIYKWLCAGHCESKKDRQTRSFMAQKAFSIQRMSVDLDNLLHGRRP